jgi:hypothetical protein
MPRNRSTATAIGHKDDDIVYADLMAELLTAVVHFMLRSGMSRSAILDSLVVCGERVRTRRATRVARENLAIGCDTVAGTVMRAWHRLPNYLDDSAKPRPLRLDGSAPSLSRLIRNSEPHANVSAVVEAMKKGGLVRQNSKGMYVAKQDSATVSAMHPFTVNHVARSIIRLVETVERNTSSSRKQLPLIERYVYVPDLRRASAKEFVKYSRQQGQAFMDSIEDWLVARQGKFAINKSGKGQQASSAGVQVFAYLGSQSSRKRQSSPANRPRPTPARAARA